MPEEFIAISHHQLSIINYQLSIINCQLSIVSISPWLYLVPGKLFYAQFGKYGENSSTENLGYGEP